MARVPVVQDPTTSEAAEHNLRVMRPIRLTAAPPTRQFHRDLGRRPMAPPTAIKVDVIGFYYPGCSPAMNFSDSPPPYRLGGDGNALTCHPQIAASLIDAESTREPRGP